MEAYQSLSLQTLVLKQARNLDMLRSKISPPYAWLGSGTQTLQRLVLETTFLFARLKPAVSGCWTSPDPRQRFVSVPQRSRAGAFSLSLQQSSALLMTVQHGKEAIIRLKATKGDCLLQGIFVIVTKHDWQSLGCANLRDSGAKLPSADDADQLRQTTRCHRGR